MIFISSINNRDNSPAVCATKWQISEEIGRPESNDGRLFKPASGSATTVVEDNDLWMACRSWSLGRLNSFTLTLFVGMFAPATSINFESMPSTINAIFVSAVSLTGTAMQCNDFQRMNILECLPAVDVVVVSWVICEDIGGVIVDESPFDVG